MRKNVVQSGLNPFNINLGGGVERLNTPENQVKKNKHTYTHHALNV